MKNNFLFKRSFMVLCVLLYGCTKAIIDEGDSLNLPPIERTITYEADIESIMYNNCVTCHGGPAPSAGADLTNYQNVKYYAEDGVLLDRMTSQTNPMPPGGLLATDKRQIIEKWIADGLPQK